LNETYLIDKMQAYAKELEEVYYTPESIECKINKDNSKTVWLFEHAIIKIVELKKQTRIELPKKIIRILNLQDRAVFTKSSPDWAKFTLDEEMVNKILSNIKEMFLQCYKDNSEDSFGCCSRYLECSDKKSCIHPDRERARGCMYKTNLDKGLIFYGENRNTV